MNNTSTTANILSTVTSCRDKHQQPVQNGTNTKRPFTPTKMYPSRKLERTPPLMGLTDKKPKTPRTTNRNDQKQLPHSHQRSRHFHIPLPHWTSKIRPGPALSHIKHNEPCNKQGSCGRGHNRIRSQYYPV